MVTVLFVMARILANPISNVFQKQLALRGASPFFIVAATHALLTVAVLPFLVSAQAARLGLGFWVNMLICTVLAVMGNGLLIHALRRSDLSVLGPINSYKAVLSLLLGIFLLREVPTFFGLAGVVLIVLGSTFIVDKAAGQRHLNAFGQLFRDRGVQLRFAAMALSATEAVFLKRAILHASPGTTFLFWCILGLPVAATAVALIPSRTTKQRITTTQEMRRAGRLWRTYLWLAITTGAMQAATLFTFGKLQVGYALALFQLSTLISVFLGYRYFAERNIRRRLIGSIIMVLGAVFIVWLGRPT